MNTVNIKNSLAGRPVSTNSDTRAANKFKKVKCCIPNCISNLANNAKTVNFHKFPRQKKVKNGWVKALNDAKLYKKVTKNTGCDCDDWFICSRHFRKEDFIKSSREGSKTLNRKASLSRFLLQDAVPSIFVVTKKLRKKTTTKQRIVVTGSTVLETKVVKLASVALKNGNNNGDSESCNSITKDKPVTRYSSSISSSQDPKAKKAPQVKSVEKGMFAAVKSWLFPSRTQSPSENDTVPVIKKISPRSISIKKHRFPLTSNPSIPNRSIKSIKPIKTEPLKGSKASGKSAKSPKINPKNDSTDVEKINNKSLATPVLSEGTNSNDSGTIPISKDSPRRSMRVASNTRSQFVPFQIPWTNFYPSKRRFSKPQSQPSSNPSQVPGVSDLSCKLQSPKSLTVTPTPTTDLAVCVKPTLKSKARSLKFQPKVVLDQTICADLVGRKPCSPKPPIQSVQVAVDNYLSSSSVPQPIQIQTTPDSESSAIPRSPRTGRKRSPPKPRPPKVNLNMSLAKKRSGALARPVQNIRNAKPERKQHAIVHTMLSSAISKILEKGTSKKIKFKSFTYPPTFPQPKLLGSPVVLPRTNIRNKHQSHKRSNESHNHKSESSNEDDDDDSLFIDGKAPWEWEVDDDERKRNKIKFIGHKVEVSANHEDEESNGYHLPTYKELSFKMESDEDIDDNGELSHDPLENEEVNDNGEIVNIKQEKMEPDDEYSTPLLNGFEFNVGMCQGEVLDMISSSGGDTEGEDQFAEESFEDNITKIECIPEYNPEATDEFPTVFEVEHDSEVFNIVKVEIMDSDSCHSDLLLPDPDFAGVKVESETIFT